MIDERYGMDVQFIGGEREEYAMFWYDRYETIPEALFLSLEEVQDTLRQFKKLLKEEQWKEI